MITYSFYGAGTLLIGFLRILRNSYPFRPFFGRYFRSIYDLLSSILSSCEALVSPRRLSVRLPWEVLPLNDRGVCKRELGISGLFGSLLVWSLSNFRSSIYGRTSFSFRNVSLRNPFRCLNQSTASKFPFCLPYSKIVPYPI